MKILKPGKVEQKKFTCPKCGCVFVATKHDTHSALRDETTVECPCCYRYLLWSSGEPYEEPVQDDRKRLIKLFNEGKDRTNFIDYLIDNGVTFKEV